MAVAQGYGKTVTSGSVFAYDTGDTRNSYSGRPTTNVSAGYGLYNYNNVPGNVTTAITTTGETYKGAAVYKQTITPLDSTGVSYLTNGNNPGLGVYHSGGGGTGGQYSGHTIFFKPVGPMYSTPIFTHYSNIGGWQSTSNYEDMGDGWFRAKVLWYYPSTLSDNKYWAINPSGATTNVPITIYWAGPFKENLNSTTISQFVEGTRSATQGLLPLVGNSTIDLTNVSFDSNAQMTFDGTNDYVNLADFNIFNGNLPFSVELIFSITAFNGDCILVSFFGENLLMYTFGDSLASEVLGFRGYINNTWVTPVYTPSLSIGKYYYVNTTYSPTSGFKLYLDGVNTSSNSLVGSITSYTLQNSIGSLGNNTRFFNGQVPVAKIYNRALSAAEVRQNYLHYKTRFNLS